MKLPLSAAIVVVFSIFASTEVQALSGAAVADLKAKWAISNPDTLYDPVTNTFTMIYPGTDDSIIASSNLRVSFFDENCKDPVISGEDSGEETHVLNQGINNVIVTEEKQTYVFPTVDVKPQVEGESGYSGGFVHGLCVLGAASAAATSSNLDVTYETDTSESGFTTGTKLWSDREYVAVGVNGGRAELCEGGLYLKPSKVWGPKTGTDITVEAIPTDASTGVTVCAFMEIESHSHGGVIYDRRFNWHNLLPERGFKESVATFGWSADSSGTSNIWKSHCKPLKPQATLSFKLDTDVLAKNNKIYASPSAATDNKGEMKVCIRMSVGYVAGEGFMEVNSIESMLTIKYDLASEINLSEFNVAPKIKDTSIRSKEYAVKASLCSDSPPAFNQGSLICVEVKPNGDSAKDGIIIKSIDSFDWKRGNIAQPAITGSNVVSNNELTSITCVANSEKCSIKSILFADFYESNGDVSGSGTATIMFKPNRRALMGGSASGRSLQEADAAATATSEFDISIPVVSIPVGASDDGVGTSDDGVGALSGASLFGFTTLASIVGLVGAVLLV